MAKPNIKKAKKALGSLQQNPGDAKALGELAAYVEAQEKQSQKRTQGGKQVGKLGASMWMGKPLFRATGSMWQAWSSYFDGRYEPTTERRWPEDETRQFVASLLVRLTRVGMLGIFLAMVPALMLLFQTALMMVQVWQVNAQNDIIREQNRLTRTQFGLAYQSQFKAQLYDNGKASPQARAEAARALMQLKGLVGEQPQLRGAKLGGTDLSFAKFSGVTFVDVSLKGTQLKETTFKDSTFKGGSLENARADRASFEGAKLSGINVQGIRLVGANLASSTWQGADFKDAVLTKASFKGASFYPDKTPQSRDAGKAATFLGASAMRDLSFAGANLIRAVFQQGTLLRATFDNALMLETNFSGATLRDSSFKEADLSRANFSGATLKGVDFTGAALKGVAWTGATFEDVTCPNGSSASSSGC